MNFEAGVGKLENAAVEVVQENADLFKTTPVYPNTRKEISRFMKNVSLGRYHYVSFAVTTGYKSLNYRDPSDNLGYTALHLASSKGLADTVNELLKYKADPNIRNSVGDFPIHLAWNCWRNSGESDDEKKKTVEVVHCLLKWGAFANCITTDKGDTPLHIACRLGPLEVVKVLLGFKADHQLRNRRGFTPVDVAADNGNEEILNLLNCWEGVRSQLVNVDFVVQWKSFLSDYDAVISKGKDVSTLIFEMNMRENIRKQELLSGEGFIVDDPVLIRSKNEAVMHQKITAREIAEKAAAEEESLFDRDDCGKTETSEGLGLGPKGTSMFSADVPEWMQLMNVPVRKKKGNKQKLDPVKAYYNDLVEKNRPKESDVIKKKYLEATKRREEREGKYEETDPFASFVSAQYDQDAEEDGNKYHKLEETPPPRPTTRLQSRRQARARQVGLDAKFELYTKRPCTSSAMFISRRSDNAPLKGTEEENDMNRFFSTPTRTRNLVVQAIENKKKMGIRAYIEPDRQKLNALGSYENASTCIANPTSREQLYDRVVDENSENARKAKENRIELNKMIGSGKLTDSWRGKKVDMVPSEKRMRFVAKDLVPPIKEMSALEELKSKIKKDQDKLGIKVKEKEKEAMEEAVEANVQADDNDGNDNEGNYNEGEKDSKDISAIEKKIQELENGKKHSNKKISYGKGRLTSSFQMKRPLDAVWKGVKPDYQLKVII